ncbi:MAG: hypothetical protein E6J90_05940 [Deltaproteobacteria bacterium]|nr:MAG: hypothetical protein E6J91_31855 [Deltaproteobacteria bacterium]TMQ25471.1 MAG: hypothetical protein E6J90_05940 [Deltaproteobacteria bacterium]
MVIGARISIGLAVGLAVAAACHRQGPTARERVLAGLPADAVAVVAADGRALSHPRLRAVLDAAAVRWPSSLGCVVDAAVASDAVAATLDRAGNVTVIAALPRPPRCPALSQRAPGLWIATLGAGPAATGGLDDPRFARARPYLLASPIAAAVLGDVHVLAAAQPEPFDAWVAIDVPGDADPVARAIAEQITRLGHEPATAAIAARVHAARTAPGQLVVRMTDPGDGDLAAAARSLLAWADEPGPRAPPAAFACPASGTGATVIVCSDGTRYRVASLASELSAILDTGRPVPAVASGSVTGLRLGAAVRELGLDAGDVIVAMAGRVVTSRKMLADWIAHSRGETTVTVRRGGTEAVLQFAER